MLFLLFKKRRKLLDFAYVYTYRFEKCNIFIHFMLNFLIHMFCYTFKSERKLFFYFCFFLRWFLVYLFYFWIFLLELIFFRKYWDTEIFLYIHTRTVENESYIIKLKVIHIVSLTDTCFFIELLNNFLLIKNLENDSFPSCNMCI